MLEPIVVPPLGETVTEVVVDRWHVAVGDRVEAGQSLLELESDKASFEVRAIDEGRLTARYVAEGAVAREGDVLGMIERPAPGVAKVAGAGFAGGEAPVASGVVAAEQLTYVSTPSAPRTSATPGPIWEVRIHAIPIGSRGFELEQGWEPFGVLDANRIVLRRRR